MGNRQSSSSPEFDSGCRRFSTSELRDLKTLFMSLAAQSGSGGKFISLPVFQAYYGIRGSLGFRLFALLTRMRSDQHLFYEDLVIAKAVYEKGSPEEIESFIYDLVDILGDGFVQRDRCVYACLWDRKWNLDSEIQGP